MRHVPALLIFASFIPAAQADEICFKPVHFGDIFKLSEINTGADTLLFGNEYAIENGSTARYSLPVVGSLEPVPLSKPAVKRLGLHGVNVSVHWGNHSDCTFAFDVDPQTLAPATPAVIS
jgi:hypothetical protein